MDKYNAMAYVIRTFKLLFLFSTPSIGNLKLCLSPPQKIPVYVEVGPMKFNSKGGCLRASRG